MVLTRAQKAKEEAYKPSDQPNMQSDSDGATQPLESTSDQGPQYSEPEQTGSKPAAESGAESNNSKRKSKKDSSDLPKTTSKGQVHSRSDKSPKKRSSGMNQEHEVKETITVLSKTSETSPRDSSSTGPRPKRVASHEAPNYESSSSKAANTTKKGKTSKGASLPEPNAPLSKYSSTSQGKSTDDFNSPPADSKKSGLKGKANAKPITKSAAKDKLEIPSKSTPYSTVPPTGRKASKEETSTIGSKSVVFSLRKSRKGFSLPQSNDVATPQSPNFTSSALKSSDLVVQYQTTELVEVNVESSTSQLYEAVSTDQNKEESSAEAYVSAKGSIKETISEETVEIGTDLVKVDDPTSTIESFISLKDRELRNMLNQQKEITDDNSGSSSADDDSEDGAVGATFGVLDSNVLPSSVNPSDPGTQSPIVLPDTSISNFNYTTAQSATKSLAQDSDLTVQDFNVIPNDEANTQPQDALSSEASADPSSLSGTFTKGPINADENDPSSELYSEGEIAEVQTTLPDFTPSDSAPHNTLECLPQPSQDDIIGHSDTSTRFVTAPTSPQSFGEAKPANEDNHLDELFELAQLAAASKSHDYSHSRKVHNSKLIDPFTATVQDHLYIQAGKLHPKDKNPTVLKLKLDKRISHSDSDIVANLHDPLLTFATPKKDGSRINKADLLVQDLEAAKQKSIAELQVNRSLLIHPKTKSEQRKEKDLTAGEKWFNMPAPELTDEIKRDLQVLKMRNVLDPKRFYKKDKRAPPKYFQMGTVIEDKSEFYSSRLAKKDRKSTMVDELLHDKDTQGYFKSKFSKLQDESIRNGRTSKPGKFLKNKKFRKN